MNSSRSTSRKIEWGPLIVVLGGALLFLLGVGRFILAHRFSLSDALHCCLAVIPAGILLLVIAYVVQHAVLASIVPLGAAGVLVFVSPVFDIAIGLVLMGMIAESVMSERKCEEALRKYNDVVGGENKDPR